MSTITPNLGITLFESDKLVNKDFFNEIWNLLDTNAAKSSDVSILSTSVSQHTTQISDLTGRVTAAESDIDSLTTLSTNQGADISALQADSHASTVLGTKTIDETSLGDKKVVSYDLANDKLVFIALPPSGIPDWASAISYALNQAVVYSGILYRCITPHTSSASFTTDEANWQSISSSGGGGGTLDWGAF